MKLSLYIARHVLLLFLLVILVVVAIDFVFAVIGEIKAVGQNGYSWHDAFLYVLFRIPSDIDLILPIAGFLGTLIALLILSSKSELIAMRAAGFSMRQIAKSILLAGAGLLIIFYVLSLFFAPYTRHLAYMQQNFQGKDQNVLVLSTETWLKSGNHFLLMGEILPDGEIHNVTDFVIQNGVLAQVRKIKSITLHPDQTWTLQGVSSMQLSPKGIVSTVMKTDLTEQSLISAALLPALAMEPDEMSVHTLYTYIQFRKDNKLDVKSYELQFWERIFSPLLLPIMMLIAIPFGMSSNRGGIQIRLVLSMVVGFSFYVIGQFFGSITLLSPLPPILGASLPILVFGVLAFVLFSLRP